MTERHKLIEGDKRGERRGEDDRLSDPERPSEGPKPYAVKTVEEQGRRRRGPFGPPLSA